MKLVSFVKKSSDIQSKLAIRLKIGGKTRPLRGLSDCFSALIESWDDLSAIAETKDKLKNLLDQIDVILVKKIHTKVLRGFKYIFDELEASNKPTIHLVLPNIYGIFNDFSICEDDSPEIICIKKKLKR